MAEQSIGLNWDELKFLSDLYKVAVETGLAANSWEWKTTTRFGDSLWLKNEPSHQPVLTLMVERKEDQNG